MSSPKEERAEFVPLPPKVEAPLNELPLVVEISSSSEKSTTSEEVGEEATSSALVPSNGKRAASFDLSTVSPSAENLRKVPRLSEKGKTESFDPAPAISPEEGQNAFDLPEDFLEPLALEDIPLNEFALGLPDSPSRRSAHGASGEIVERISRQFWKAGDYDSFEVDRSHVAGGMDHVRVHPKFLHSNATSHKWALGAIAELIDNALDEAVNGAKVANIDMIRNPRDESPMLMIEDDGGGMDPERMRQCMSLGYSAKSKIANTIGQYGNGFKTSTMRLGADVIVFSRCPSKGKASPTQSVGLLSYTFLTATGQDDIIVPMIDYEVQPFGLRKLIRSNVEDWNRNIETILQWCPYETEKELLDQLNRIQHQGTAVIVYNLWEDEQGETELDFDANRYDIQLRGTNRNEKNISMARKYPNCKHYFTYRYSLRSYVSILYLRLPSGFKIILRGSEVVHHNLAHDLMLTEKLTYRPQTRTEQSPKDYRQMMAVVTIGFLKDAREHIDVQGFNVYHKNRLIKPFWRLWNLPGVQGRGIVGVLEANFVEPAHDKQDFERTIILARLEARLLEIQKRYWSKNCQEVGYFNPSSKKTGKIAPNVDSAEGDQAVQNSIQVSKELQTPSVHLVEVRASNSPSIACQRQFHTVGSKIHEVLPKPISDVPPQSIPLPPRGPSRLQTTVQTHPCTASVKTNTAQNEAMPRALDRQKQLQTHTSVPLLVTRQLRSPLLRVPSTLHQNHTVVGGQEHTAPGQNTGMRTQRQISADKDPLAILDVSVVTSPFQTRSIPTVPELSATVISGIESGKSPKETQSFAKASVSSITKSSISLSGQDEDQAASSTGMLLPPLAPKCPSQSESKVPAHPCTVAMRTCITHEAIARTSSDSQASLQTQSSMLLPVTRSLRTPMLPTAAYENGVAIEEAHTAPKPNTGTSSQRQMLVGEIPTVFSDVSPVTSLSQELSIPVPELSASGIARIASKNSQSEIQSSFNAAVLPISKSSVSQPVQAELQAVLSAQTLLSPQFETLKSPLGEIAAGVSGANLASTDWKRKECQQDKPVVQMVALADLDHGSASSSKNTLSKEIKTMAGIESHVAELNPLLQTLPNEADASSSALRLTEGDNCSFLNETESSAELKAKIIYKLEVLKQKVASLQLDLIQITKERDFLRAELENERKKKILEDEKLQSRLQAALLRARELEDENKRLQLSRR